jgi:hypothetical protein
VALLQHTPLRRQDLDTLHVVALLQHTPLRRQDLDTLHVVALLQHTPRTDLDTLHVVALLQHTSAQTKREKTHKQHILSSLAVASVKEDRSGCAHKEHAPDRA